MAARWILLMTLAAACDRGGGTSPPRQQQQQQQQQLAAPRPARIVGYAGPNELLADAGWMPLAGAPRAAFEARLAATHEAALRVVPSDLPAGAQLGTMSVGGARQAVWIVTGDAQRGYTFRFDADLDGDLTNDAPHALAPDGHGDWAADVVTAALVFRVSIHAGEIALVVTTQRRGTLDVGGRRVAFVLAGLMGRYGADKELVAFDLDGDGSADLDPSGDEALYVRDRRVTIGSAAYDFAVAADGATLTLAPTPPDAPPAGRPSIRVGAPAPDFALPDVGGHRVALADLRGEVVVLDFWARWCAPCVRAIPDLAALDAKDRNAGLAVVSVAIEDAPGELPAFIAEHHMTWPQLAVTAAAPITDAYRAVTLPDLFVIGRDGRFACSHCDRADLTATVEAALAHH